MQKKYIKVLVVLFVLIALGGSYGYYNFFRPDPKTEQQLNEQFGSDFFKPTLEEKKTGSESIPQPEDKPSQESDKGSASVTAPAVSAATEPKVAKAPEGSEAPVLKAVTVNDVKNKFLPRFNQLQSLALSRLDTLFAAAVQEYKQRKADGTLNRTELAQKYMQAGTRLEAGMDSQFNSVLAEMKSELVANGLPTDAVAAVEAEYNNAKSAKRSQLLEKIAK